MSVTRFPAFADRPRLTVFDLAAILGILGIAVVLAGAARATLAPLPAPDMVQISLDPRHLPAYALRTTLRMFVALACSFLFTFTYATWAAKSRRAGLVLVPVLDLLQSVPILGFLSFTVVFFLNLFPGRMLGAESAAIFAIFTSQAWNMAFSFYQSLITVPSDLDEAATAFGLSPWQRFWRLDAPFAMPGLIWNTMMSMSGGWFFVVASEAITVGDTTVKLPGVGSYVALALERRDIHAVGYAIAAMLVVILLYDQLLFRPLVAWSGKFRFEMVSGGPDVPDPWMLALLRRAGLLRWGVRRANGVFLWATGRRLGRAARRRTRVAPNWVGDTLFFAVLAGVMLVALLRIVQYVSATLHWSDLRTALLLGLFTLARVAVLMALASAIWVPVGVWLGLRPARARWAQPVAQFLAAFPANLFFPVFVVAIVRYGLLPDIWLTPLMVLGTQWYILFNVVAGAAAFPSDLREVSRNFRVGGLLWWRRVILPGIAPYYVTGAITASGGSWNAAIVAEVASWGSTRVQAHGLGAYIANATDAGHTARIVLGVAVMAAYVMLCNRLIWRPLHAFTMRRLSF